MVKGGTHPRQKTTVNVPAIVGGYDALGSIFYQANTNCLTQSSNFAVARFCTADMFGGSNKDNVHLAWDAVGVPRDLSLTVSPSPAPTNVPTTASPSFAPTNVPTSSPSFAPTNVPTASPTFAPTNLPTSKSNKRKPKANKRKSKANKQMPEPMPTNKK
jgi:hypothetical protein